MPLESIGYRDFIITRGFYEDPFTYVKSYERGNRSTTTLIVLEPFNEIKIPSMLPDKNMPLIRKIKMKKIKKKMGIYLYKRVEKEKLRIYEKLRRITAPIYVLREGFIPSKSDIKKFNRFKDWCNYIVNTPIKLHIKYLYIYNMFRSITKRSAQFLRFLYQCLSEKGLSGDIVYLLSIIKNMDSIDDKQKLLSIEYELTNLRNSCYNKQSVFKKIKSNTTLSLNKKAKVLQRNVNSTNKLTRMRTSPE